MIPIKKSLYAALILSMVIGLASDADDSESQQLTRTQASGLTLKGQLSKDVYRVEQKQESYEVDVPYETQVPYTEIVPYEDSETYEEQVPYEGTETYEVDVPYEGTESYEVQVPYETTESYDEQIPYETQEAYEERIPYADKEAYEARVPYEETETYHDTETTYTTEQVCQTVTDYRESCQVEKICRKNPVQEGECKMEQVCRERNGQKTCFEQKKCNPSTGGDEVCTDKNVCRKEPYSKNECSNKQVPHTSTVTKTRTVTKYRTETRYRDVTHYRTETRYRKVTKYRTETRQRRVILQRNETRTRTVTLYRREERTRTVTLYRTEQRVRKVVRQREETRCCKTEIQMRKETKCCVTRDVTVLDHTWTLPYTIRFPEAAKLEADEQEVLTSLLKGTESQPDLDLNIQSQIFNYKIDKSSNTKEVQIALSIVPHLDPKDMGQGTIADFRALYNPDGYIITFKDVGVFRRVNTKYRIQILDSDKKVIWSKEETARSQSVRVQSNIELDETKNYTIQVAAQRTGVILKAPVQFVAEGKLELTKYSKEEVGEKTVSDLNIEDRQNKKILWFEDKGHIAKIETKYAISVVNADLEKVVWQKDLLAKDVLSTQRKVEVDITEAITDSKSTYRVVVTFTRNGSILSEQIQFRKVTEIKNKIDLEALKNPALVAGIEIKGNGDQAVVNIVDKAPETQGVRTSYIVILKRDTLGIERRVAQAGFDRASFKASAMKDLSSSQVERYFAKGAKLIFEITVTREITSTRPSSILAKITKKYTLTVK